MDYPRLSIAYSLDCVSLISYLHWVSHQSSFGAMSPSDDEYFTWNARGNEASCDAQGFLFAVGVFGGLLIILQCCTESILFGSRKVRQKRRIHPNQDRTVPTWGPHCHGLELLDCSPRGQTLQ